MDVVELLKMGDSDVLDYLVTVDEGELAALHRSVILSAEGGALSADGVERYMVLTRQAGERLIREAEQLRKYGRLKRAGIRGVIDGDRG